MAEPALFGEPTAAEPSLSCGARRTRRQAQALDQGWHPLSLLPGVILRLSPAAPPPGDRKAPGPRCGGCQFAVRNAWGYIKCTRGRTGETGTKSRRAGPFESRGDATTIRAWWPGCERWQARDE